MTTMQLDLVPNNEFTRAAQTLSWQSLPGDTRQTLTRLIANVCLGKVGAVGACEVSRFARISRDWQHRFEMCRVVETTLIDPEHDTTHRW